MDGDVTPGGLFDDGTFDGGISAMTLFDDVVLMMTSRLGVGLREVDPVGRFRELGCRTAWPVRVLSSPEVKDSRVVE